LHSNLAAATADEAVPGKPDARCQALYIGRDSAFKTSPTPAMKNTAFEECAFEEHASEE
jgi:hypothetical protein